MGTKEELLIFDSTTLRVFFICTALLVMKILFMVPLIARYRFTKKIFISPEDTVFRKGAVVKYNDPDIIRVKAAHLNDLENILIFISVGFFYANLNPSPFLSIPLFIAFTVARYAHTFAYVFSKKQPFRLVCFFAGFVITAYMASHVALSLRDAM